MQLLIDMKTTVTEPLSVCVLNTSIDALHVDCVTVSSPFLSTYDTACQSVKALAASWTSQWDQSRQWGKLYVPSAICTLLAKDTLSCL